MLKISHFLGESEAGPLVIPLFGPADSTFEKIASPSLLPEVVRYIELLRPQKNSQYVLVNAMGAGEYWGCFPAGTLIQTSKGEKPIEKITIGEQVLTHKNRFRSVTATLQKQTDKLCDLYIQGFPSTVPALTSTPNHELWMVTREEFIQKKRKYIWKEDTGLDLKERREKALSNLEFSWASISDLQPGDMVAEPFPLGEDAMALGDEKWNTPEVAFLMGLYAAEGCVAYRYRHRADRPSDLEDHEPCKIVYITGSHEAATHIEAQRCASVLGHKMSQQVLEDHATKLELCFKELAQLCLEHIGSLAAEKSLSNSILLMPRGWQETFFKAYAGGDGCVRGVGKGEGTIRCISASAALLRDSRLLLARLGLTASISGRYNEKATWYSGKPIFELSISGGQFNGDSSSKIYLHPDGYILSSVKSTKQYAWDGGTYDLMIEEDSSFVASGIAVHNSNVNGDHFPETALIHRPDNWTNNPLIDKISAKDWAYGFPTFYGAHAFAHHKNKDVSRAYGTVELSTWNPNMKRVELVIRVDKDKCEQFGGTGVWDKLKAGQFADVSMGCKVPFDTCSICLDWDAYSKALANFHPGEQRHPGEAVLAVHKKLKASNGVGIKGVSITRADYCEHAKKLMNRILPDGRKVFVYNDFPRFFDISFVFIGADKTAKVMLFIYRNGAVASVKPSAEVAEDLGYKEVPDFPKVWPKEKAASVEEEMLKVAFFGKAAKNKNSEITKDVIPSQFVGKAVPVLSQREEDLPRETLDALSSIPLNKALSTTAGLGMVIRPREFQRIVLTQLGKGQLADELDSAGKVFPKVDEEEPVGLSTDYFLPALARLLLPLLALRSALGPVIEKRAVISLSRGAGKQKAASSHSSDLLRKIGAAYNGYRRELIDLVPSSQSMIASASLSTDTELHKIANASVEEIFTPMSVAYFKNAFLEEVPIGDMPQGVVKLSVSGRKPACRGVSPQ